MNCQFIRRAQILPVAALILFAALRADATPITLTQATPTYTYDILAQGPGTADPNAVLGGTMQGRSDASYYGTSGDISTLAYTFNLGPGAEALKLNEYNLYAFGGTGSILGQYSINGGPAVTLYNDSTSVIAPGANDVVDLQHINTISLNPALANSVVVTYTVDATQDQNYQQQLLRHGNADGGPFIATATFTPEPSSLVLCGLGAIGLAAVVRRRRS